MTKFVGVNSPCYILEEELLLANLAKIDYVRERSGAEVIVALKANAMWSIFPLLAAHSDGATASSVAEARLVAEEFGSRAHTYAPLYTDSNIEEIIAHSSHITFNSLGQYHRFSQRALLNGISCGLRVNPRYSPVETDLYNPCVAGSRLGVTPEELGEMEELPAGLEGLHFHVLCESKAEDLRLALDSFERYYGRFIPQLKWLNMGGGHLMTHADYDCEELITILKEFKAKYPHLRLILEPGSAFTWRTGSLLSTIEDIVENGGVRTAMLDVSFACHMPDCLEMPYKPSIIGAHDPKEGEQEWRMGGNSCLAGDYCGTWAFDQSPKIGDKIIFEDMIHYTMVKTTMFNGVAHPSIAIAHTDGSVEVVREFGYEDYKNRLS